MKLMVVTETTSSKLVMVKTRFLEVLETMTLESNQEVDLTTSMAEQAMIA